MLYEVITDENGQPVEVDTEILSDTRIRITSERAVRSATVTVTGTIEKGQNPLVFIAESTVRILMSVRVITSYSIHYTKLYDNPDLDAVDGHIRSDDRETGEGSVVLVTEKFRKEEVAVGIVVVHRHLIVGQLRPALHIDH